uniref:Putative head-tail connector n=1 Tax=viral metagenome TaxID=1070528 RepID=A0A6M3KZ91_9ZZZZ
MIVSVDECKAILGITDNASDQRIRDLIPYVQDDIRIYCNNAFGDTTIYRQSAGSLAFVRGSTLTSSTSPDTITDADNYFSTAGFRAGTDIIVLGGSNEGYHTLAVVAAGTLTLTSTGALENQSQTTYHNWPGEMQIARVQWPTALKPIAAKMVWHLIETAKQGDVKSESIDDYSVTFAGSHSYPERVIAGLRQFRRVILV